jgi:hypothetical protein
MVVVECIINVGVVEKIDVVDGTKVVVEGLIRSKI